MLNLFSSPISYNTDINSIVFNYTTGAAQGFNPFSYNFYNNFNYSSIFSPFNTYLNSFYQTTPLFNPFNSIFNNYTPFSNTYSNNNNNFSYYGPYMNIYQINNNYLNTEYETKTETETIKNKTNTKVENTTPTTKPEQNEESKKIQTSKYLGMNLANNAKQYLGYNEADGSYRKFSDNGEWCADFVSYVVKETYQKKGLTPPNGFGNHRVENLKQWGINNDKFFSLVDKEDKANEIKNNVSIGDILILRENGASHTGIISKINDDGSFEAIEGNRSDKVAIGKYSPENNEISGFIKLAS